MNKQIESVAGMADGAIPARPLGVRAAGKARTRQRLIDAARRLFMERGYEGATVRDIAASAGLSTGAVFASFNDKTELFNAVLTADSETQIGLMNQASSLPGSVQERLVRTLTAAYGFQLGQIELLRAALAVSWSQGLSGELGDRPIRGPAIEKICEVLTEGAERGEIRAGCDLGILTDTIWDCFIGNYRQAMFDGQGLEVLGERLSRQVELIMTGARSDG
jgi:AcrR family transcriptional regulator